jgi:Uma2 family endonuclease
MAIFPVPAIPPELDGFLDLERPYVEAIDGRLIPKTSPKTLHSIVQSRVTQQLGEWERGRGLVGTEWRFYLIPGDPAPSSLVPDVAYVAKERLPREPEDARERPRFAPDIAVEILSPREPREPRARIARKVKLYLEHGARVVVVLDPLRRVVTFHWGGESLTIAARGVVQVPQYEDLALDFDRIFSDL